MLDKLGNIILNYESNTFSGAELTPADADKIASLLFARFLTIVREGGTLRCDGDVLAKKENKDDNAED